MINLINVLWIIIATLLVVFLAAARCFFTLRISHNGCPHCGYPRTGITSVPCPECGEPFDGAVALQLARRARRLRWVAGLVAVVSAALLVFWLCSVGINVYNQTVASRAASKEVPPPLRTRLEIIDGDALRIDRMRYQVKPGTVIKIVPLTKVDEREVTMHVADKQWPLSEPIRSPRDGSFQVSVSRRNQGDQVESRGIAVVDGPMFHIDADFSDLEITYHGSRSVHLKANVRIQTDDFDPKEVRMMYGTFGPAELIGETVYLEPDPGFSRRLSLQRRREGDDQPIRREYIDGMTGARRTTNELMGRWSVVEGGIDIELDGVAQAGEAGLAIFLNGYLQRDGQRIEFGTGEIIIPPPRGGW